MFKEYLAFSSELEHSFRLLFGVSVQLATRATHPTPRHLSPC